MSKNLIFGAERFCEDHFNKHKKKNIALIANQSSIVFDRENIFSCLLKKRAKIKKVFFPQHGFFQDKQDNMIESDDFNFDGIKFISLYGKKFSPSEEDLNGIELILYDVQDVGAKIYTFVSTLFLFLKALNGKEIEFMILDRPNPLGRKVEGNITEKNYISFVGIYPLPMLYGLTPAELAFFFITEERLDINFSIIKMENWNGEDYEKSGRFWYPPSPNMPFYTTSYVYPGTVLLEGTNFSEGRGTTRPFEVIGAPFVNADELSEKLNNLKLRGVSFIPFSFTPTFNKWAGELCKGVFLRVKDLNLFDPYKTGIYILKVIRELYGDSLEWKLPPYEYEEKKLPIDIISGSSMIRKFVDGEINSDELTKILNPRSFIQKIESIRVY